MGVAEVRGSALGEEPGASIGRQLVGKRELDQHAQFQWDIAPRWQLSGGVRHTSVPFKVQDRYITGANPDDSGAVRYRGTSPVAGILFRVTEAVNAYAAIGRGFETPTFAELAYRPDGQPGVNFGLRPAISLNSEAGVKAYVRADTRLNLALFKISLVIRLTRAGMREVLLADYVKYAHAKGLSERRVILVHVLKNILIPVVTVLGLELGSVIAYSVVTESVFAWPGMGKLVIDAINILDRPIIVAYLMVVVLMFTLINLAVDLLYTVIDPRVRLRPAAA